MIQTLLYIYIFLIFAIFAACIFFRFLFYIGALSFSEYLSFVLSIRPMRMIYNAIMMTPTETRQTQSVNAKYSQSLIIQS